MMRLQVTDSTGAEFTIELTVSTDGTVEAYDGDSRIEGGPDSQWIPSEASGEAYELWLKWAN